MQLLFGDRTGMALAAALLVSLVLVTPRIAESDAIEYFSYLPSVLLDGDLDFEDEYRQFYEEDPEGRQGFKETFLDRPTDTGLRLNFGPIGSAVLWSPFYIATHIVLRAMEAMGADVQADGMSQPYRTAVSFASALYGAIGLLLSYRLARRFASPFPSLVAVVALWWATPVAYYMYIAPGMSHAPSLFAVAVFFCLWPWVTETGSVGRWAVWGASAGLMLLVREQDVFFVVAAAVPLLSGLGARLEEIDGERVREVVKRAAAFGGATFVVFAPQLVVYQILNGRPAPSPLVGRKMEWWSPHALQVLFSPEHGLFFWSPILLLFLAGGLWLFRRDRAAASMLLLGFVSQVYISGAVDSWTQAGAFGSRRFVGATVIFAVWGATFFQQLLPRIRRAGVAAIASVFILWNVGLMIQFGIGLMNRDRLVWAEVVPAQFLEVPPRLAAVAGRYLFSRDELAGSALPEPEDGS